MRYENSRTPRSSIQILKAFLQTDRVWDEATKREWADDVDLRLIEVISQIEPRPTLLSYIIERSANRLVIFTFARPELRKREMAALAREQWPGWDRS